MAPGGEPDVVALPRLEPLQHFERVTGRRVRILALHGGDSNSNVMKFQTAPLRKILGSNVQWTFPDAQEAGHPQKDVPEELFTKQGGLFSGTKRTPFEERLAQGKPFVSWWKYEVSEVSEGSPMPWRFKRTSYENGCDNLMDFVLREQPFDVVVGFSQGGLMVPALVHRLHQAGKQASWRLNIIFHAPNVGQEHIDFEGPLPQPTFFITSKADRIYHDQLATWSGLCTSVAFLVHDDGFRFPTSAPLATKIYTHLASEIWRHCGLSSHLPTLGSATGSAEEVVDRAGDLQGVAIIGPEALAEALRLRACLVADSRELPMPFPGAEPGISSRALRSMSRLAQQKLARLRADGRPVVVISLTDEECLEYCKMLVEQHNFQASNLRRLDGDLAAWSAWEAEHALAGGEIRRAYGLSVGVSAAARSMAPAEFAGLLQADACLVVDAREPDESRGRAFPGAQRGIGLLLLRRRPEEARQRLSRLREDDRVLVAVSETGARCQAYCASLVASFGFGAERLAWLEGGTRAWAAWSLENTELLEDIRRRHGLLPTRGRPAPGACDEGGAEAREHSLAILAQA